MSFLDYIVFGFYLAGTLSLGLFFFFRNKTSGDMFSASGQSPWWVSGLSGFMTVFSAATFVVWGGIAYEYGIVALSINMCYGIAALFVGYFVAGRWKTLNVNTPAEYIELRFGSAAVQFYIWVMLLFRVLGTAVSLYGLAVLLVVLMPLPSGHAFQDPSTGYFSVQWAILILGSVVVLYTMAGGLWAVLMTDVVQFIILSLSVVFVITLMLMNLGNIDTYTEQLPPTFFNLVNNDFTWFFLAGWCLINFFTIGAEWAFAQRFISVRNESEAKKSAYLIAGLYIVSPAIWLAPTLIYRAIDPNVNPEQAYIIASQSVLPAGMLGMMAAALFSATASMVSSQLNVFSGALTDQLYHSKMRPHAPEKELMWAGRFFSVTLGSILVALAMLIPKLGGAANVIISKGILVIGPLLTPAVWALFSRSLSAHSVWVVAGISIATGMFFRVGLAEGGIFADVQLFSGLAEWAQGSVRNVNLVIGIVFPLCVTAAMQLLSRQPDAHWQNLQAVSHERNVNAEHQPYIFDPTPSWIVIIALVACGAVMLTIAALSADSKTVLLTFGSMMLAIALIVFLMLRKSVKQTQNDIKHE